MTEREQFQKWRQDNDHQLDTYNEPDDCMWQAWQAARASQPAPEGFADAIKEKFSQIANARVEKWERLKNGGMIERAKADAVTGYGMLCDALSSIAAPTAQPERTIRTHRERDAAAAIEQQREAQGDL